MNYRYIRLSNAPSWRPPRRFAWPLLTLCIFIAFPSPATEARDEVPSLWSRLGSTSSLTWADQELHPGITEYGRTVGLDVWLDRRINPNQRVTLNCRGTVLEVFRQVAREVDAVAVWNGQFMMIGLPESVRRSVANIYQQRRQLQNGTWPLARPRSDRLLEPRPFDYPALSTPNEILQRAADRWDVPLQHIELPHDLWDGNSFAAVDFPTLLATVLAGFDLGFVVHDGKLQPVPLEQISPRYALPYEPEQVSTTLLGELRKIDPEYQIESSSGTLIIATHVEGHHYMQLAQLPNRDEASAAADSRRYDMRVVNKPAGDVLKALADARGLPLIAGSEVKSQLQRTVDVNAKQLSLDEIIDRVCKQIGLEATIGEEAIHIHHADDN